MAENLLCTLFWAIWFVRITSWIHTSLLLCLLISPFSFRSTQSLSSLDLSPAVWFLCLSPVLDPKDFPLPDPPFLVDNLAVTCLSQWRCHLKAVLLLHAQKMVKIMLYYIQDAQEFSAEAWVQCWTSALWRPMPPQEVRVMAEEWGRCLVWT